MENASWEMLPKEIGEILKDEDLPDNWGIALAYCVPPPAPNGIDFMIFRHDDNCKKNADETVFHMMKSIVIHVLFLFKQFLNHDLLEKSKRRHEAAGGRKSGTNLVCTFIFPIFIRLHSSLRSSGLKSSVICAA